MASKSDAQTSSNFEDYEEIFGRIPEAYFNAHRYLYTNGIEISEGTKEVPLIYHSDDKFEFDLPVSDVDVESIGIQLVAEFSEDVLVTRVGIRGIESYFGRPEVRIAVFAIVRKGDITTCAAKEKALQYTHFPPENRFRKLFERSGISILGEPCIYALIRVTSWSLKHTGRVMWY